MLDAYASSRSDSACGSEDCMCLNDGPKNRALHTFISQQKSLPICTEAAREHAAILPGILKAKVEATQLRRALLPITGHEFVLPHDF